MFYHEDAILNSTVDIAGTIMHLVNNGGVAFYYQSSLMLAKINNLIRQKAHYPDHA